MFNPPYRGQDDAEGSPAPGPGGDWQFSSAPGSRYTSTQVLFIARTNRETHSL